MKKTESLIKPKSKVLKLSAKERAGSIASLFFSYVFLIIVAIIVIVPIFYIVTLAFDKSGDPGRTTLLPQAWTLDGFVSLFNDMSSPSTSYARWYLNTIIVGLINMALVVFLVTPTAYAFSRLRFRGRKQMMISFMVLQMFPGMSAILAYILLLDMIGLEGSFLGIALIFSCVAVPGSSFLLKGFFDTMPRSLEEAARLDGASRLTVIVRIFLPLALPMIGLIAIFGFAAPFGDFVISNAIFSNAPQNTLLAMGMQKYIADDFYKNYTNFGAGAILASVPMTVLYIFLQKFIFKGLGASMAGSKA